MSRRWFFLHGFQRSSPTHTLPRSIAALHGDQVANGLASPPFDESDLRLAEIVATLIGKSVQVERQRK